jgi:hypothetical protein
MSRVEMSRVAARIRRQRNAVRARVALLLALWTSACGWLPADEQILLEFFEASAIYDTTMAGRVARVMFDPRVEGVVTRFDVARRADTPINGGLRREATLRAVVRAAGRERDRMLIMSMERRGSGAWTVTGYRWAE